MKKLLLLLLSLLSLLLADSQTIRLDSSFAQKGWTQIDFIKGNAFPETIGKQVIGQTDGSLIVVFEINTYTLLSRYYANGAWDSTYGREGYSEAVAMERVKATRQADGKIVVAGTKLGPRNYDFTLARFNLDGSLDQNFGTNGVVTADLGSEDFTSSVLVQHDGKIVLIGNSFNPSTSNYDLSLIRFKADGALDSTFDKDGKLISRFPDYILTRFSLTQQSDGKLVAAGTGFSSTSNSFDFVLVRYLPDGSLDKSFDVDGMNTVSIGLDDRASDIAIQNDGKIVVAGISDGNLALIRFHPDGSLDKTFDVDGKVTTAFPGSYAVAWDMVIQKDGKILLGGSLRNSTTNNTDFLLARYMPNGSLDKTFDGDGKLTTDFGHSEEAYSILLQNDGKIVLAGYIAYPDTGFGLALARYTTTGSLDRTFDSDGKLLGQYTVGITFLNAVTVQPDGNIVAAGRAFDPNSKSYDIAVVRYHPDGSLDKTFDKDGKLTTHLGTFSQTAGIALQSDGKILVAGTSDADFALVRYLSDGSLDKTFDEDGKVITNLGFGEEAFALALQKDGKIVVGGTSRGTFALARYSPNGSLDKTFDEDGMLILPFSTNKNAKITAIGIQSDGKIIVAGYTSEYETEYSDFALARFNADGSLDKTFDGGGKLTTNLGTDEQATALILQRDGKIVVGGSVNGNFALVRYLINGTLDKSFDSDGKVVTDFGSYYDYATSLALQSDGKILAAGYIYNYLNSDFALARYTTNGSLDKSFDGDGKLITDLGYNEYINSIFLHQNRIYVAGNISGPAYRGIVATYLTGCTERIYYRDKDKDGYGYVAEKLTACTPPQGYTTDSTDCNDNNAAVHPGAQELCGNNIDDNCDGQIDEGCPGTPFLTIDDVTVYEAQGAATLKVSLSRKTNLSVYAVYLTVDRTAKGIALKNQRDYEPKAGLLIIPAGQQTATITVKIFQDGIKENDEYFDVYLIKSIQAVISDPQGRVIIKDGAPVFAAPDITNMRSPKQTTTKEQSLAQQLTVSAWPNPAVDHFTLLVQSPKNAPLIIKVTDMIGRLVEVKTGMPVNSIISIGHQYTAGIYLVQVVQDGESRTIKLMKQSP